MRVSAISALMILTTIFLSACEQEQQASIEDKSMNYYGRNGIVGTAASSAPAYHAASVESILSTPITEPAPMVTTTAWQWPVDGTVTEQFGTQATGIANEGITISAAEGAPIRAAAAGEVAYVGKDVRDYGNMVIVRHPSGHMTSYAHAREILVSKGDKLRQGDIVGYVGHTGTATGPQLHFAMREGEKAIDPMTKLSQQLASR